LRYPTPSKRTTNTFEYWHLMQGERQDHASIHSQSLELSNRPWASNFVGPFQLQPILEIPTPFMDNFSLTIATGEFPSLSGIVLLTESDPKIDEKGFQEVVITFAVLQMLTRWTVVEQ